jgi:hypothetical protein
MDAGRENNPLHLETLGREPVQMPVFQMRVLD